MRNSRLRSDAEPLPPIPAPAFDLPRTPLPEATELPFDSGWDEFLAESEPTDVVRVKETV